MQFMKHVLALLPFLAATAAAQEDVYQSLQPGDRLHVTFRSGGTLIGTLVPPAPTGAAAATRKKPAVGVQAPAVPFEVIYVSAGADAAGDAQTALLDGWLKQHPEGQLQRVKAGDKEAEDLVKKHNILATPALVLRDPVTGVFQAYIGVQSAERLEAALGRLRQKTQEAKVDFSKEDFLTLDVSLEYPGLNGTMSLARKDIKDVRKLQKLDEATRRRLEEEHRKIRESQAADEAARRDSEIKRTEDAKAEIEAAAKAEIENKKKADEAKALEEKAAKLKSQDELLKQFPPEQWTEERRQLIINKSTNKLPVSPEERAFLEKQTDIAEAVKAQKERQEKEKAEKEKAAQEEKK